MNQNLLSDSGRAVRDAMVAARVDLGSLWDRVLDQQMLRHAMA